MHLGAQRAHDRFRRAGGREQAEPDVDAVAGVEFADGRQFRKTLGAMLAAGGDRAQLAGEDERGAGGAGEQHFGVARDGGLRRRRRAPERHVQQVDAGALLEHFHHELVLAAIAAGGVGDRRLGLARIVDEFLEGFDRHLRIDRQHELVGSDARDRQQVLERIKTQPRVDMRIDGDAAVRAKEQRIAVGRGLGGLGGGDVAVGAGAVLDHHRPAAGFLQILCDQPRRRVGRAARRDRHQQLDRP